MQQATERASEKAIELFKGLRIKAFWITGSQVIYI